MRPVFQSFFQGGFECSTHRRKDRKRLDAIAAVRHDALAETDYRLLNSLGVATVRDGVRWHLIERTPGRYDWSSLLPQLKAANRTATQVVWDLFHYGWPDHLDIWSPAFIDHYARFAQAVVKLMRAESDDIPFLVPINEISFTAWAGGQFAVFNPFGRGRGDELKRQLVRAAIAGIEAIRDVAPSARIVHIDPAINVIPNPRRPERDQRSKDWHEAQFAAWDMLGGRKDPELGGQARYLDIIGVNYYVHNQWLVDGGPVDWRHPSHVPLRTLLERNHRRYGRPLFLAETGIEAELRPAWLRYVCEEVFAAIGNGVPVEGICLYPVMNHPGWDDDRHCPNGLIDYSRETFRRSLFEPLAAELRRQQDIFARLRAPKRELAEAGA